MHKIYQSVMDKLDNPVWFSLLENHKRFALENDGVKFYHPDFCPFGSFHSSDNTSSAILQYSNLVDNFFIVGEKPVIPDSLHLKYELVCLQMIKSEKLNCQINERIIKLDASQYRELYNLVSLVQPGYFKEKTPLLGRYYGIFKGNKLVAVIGERMQMNGFTEVSAVVTHPDHTGKGYASQLIAHTVNAIIDENKLPFLHVAESNLAAIKLYKKLGFIVRRKISFWNIATLPIFEK